MHPAYVEMCDSYVIYYKLLDDDVWKHYLCK